MSRLCIAWARSDIYVGCFSTPERTQAARTRLSSGNACHVGYTCFPVRSTNIDIGSRLEFFFAFVNWNKQKHFSYLYSQNIHESGNKGIIKVRQRSCLNKMPLDHACMTDQEFSCGFKPHPIGEYAIGLSKSNQSLHGFSTCKDFCSEFAQIKTWEKPPIKGKYLGSIYSRGMQSPLCPLNGNGLGSSLTCCMLKLQFRLWREAQKVTQFSEFFVEITLLWYKILI